MIGVIVREGVRVRWIGGVANKATSGVGIQADEKEERQVMSVPERLEALVTNLVVRGGVHEEHDEKHEVASDTTSLGVVDVKGRLRTNLCKGKSETGARREGCNVRVRSTLKKFT